MDTSLAPFVQDGRLRSLPAKHSRRVVVLAHVRDAVFAPGTRYDEPAVNTLLREWTDGGEVDHAALRRYLVENGLVQREAGEYWVDAPV